MKKKKAASAAANSGRNFGALASWDYDRQALRRVRQLVRYLHAKEEPSAKDIGKFIAGVTDAVAQTEPGA